MGNTQYKYLTVSEAQQVLGGVDAWNEIRWKLEILSGASGSGTKNFSLAAGGRGCIDFPLFHHIVSRRFEKMPRGLCECIFTAFASDIQQKVEIEQFLCTLAVPQLPVYLSSLHLHHNSSITTAGASVLLARFIFRVYENLGSMERKRVEEILGVAYGERLSGNSQQYAQQLLDAVFDKRRQEISLRDFEQCATQNIRLDLFVTWIRYVLQVFLADTSESKVLALERKYSSFSESQELMNKYDIPKSVCDAMRSIFCSICDPTNSKAELSLSVWLATVSGLKPDPIVSTALLAAAGGAAAGGAAAGGVDEHGAEAAAAPADGSEALEDGARSAKVVGASDNISLSGSKRRGKRPRSDTMSSLTSKSGAAGDEADEMGDKAERKLVYIRPELATVIFSAKVNTFKGVWRFLDFAEFCAIYGRAGTIVAKANAVCAAFVQDSLLRYWQRVHLDADRGVAVSNAAPAQDDEAKAETAEDDYGLMPESHGDEDASTGGGETQFSDADLAINEGLKKMVYMLSQSVLDMPHPAETPSTGSQYEWPLELWQKHVSLPSKVERSLLNIQRQEGVGVFCPTQAYTQLLIEHYSLLPGLRDLSIAACCRFGLPPPSPLLEKEYVTELTLRYLHDYPQSASHPHGPRGTQWCVVSKQWYDAWRRFVGHTPHYSEFHPLRTGLKSAAVDSAAYFEDKSPAESGSAKSRGDAGRASSYQRRGSYGIAPQRPPAIDNLMILDKTSRATQLLPELQLGADIEVVPPAVFSALHAWYGGGPVIERTSVVVDSNVQDAASSSSTELELYPLCLQICTCDTQGKTIRIPGAEREVLISRASTVAELITNLCLHRHVDESRVRLWNYAEEDWKQQYILSPLLTLQSASILSGQWILMEVSLADGSWPRSQLHAALDSEDKAQQEAAAAAAKDALGEKSSGSTDSEILSSAAAGSAAARLADSRVAQMNLNSGKVGMHNLGNTCYMNSSVQSLLHTEPLMQYFLSKRHLEHLNVRNIHGFRGRLAISFGKLVSDMWTTQWNCITPKAFMQEIASLRDQFAGNEQHDAHEMLAFLLDGLSEDLNLVHDKPYTEQPDSDGRPDELLADIWWSNHLKRDRSVVQALFTGQFKSVMTCAACNNYTSARFEPFNFLTVPIPEETTQVVVASVIPLQLQHTVQCAVRVSKAGTLADVVEKLLELDLPGLVEEDACSSFGDAGDAAEGKCQRTSADCGAEAARPVHFQVGELSNCRIKSFNSLDRRVDMLRDSEHIVFFQIRRPPGTNQDRFGPRQCATDDAVDAPSEAAAAAAASDALADRDSNRSKSHGSDGKARAESFRYPHSRRLPESLFFGPNASTLVRVAFSQRRIRVCDNLSGNAPAAGPSMHRISNGFEHFLLEPFGVSLLEVLPSRISCSDLYRIISYRLRPFLKAPVRKLIRHQLMQQHSRSNVVLSPRSTSFARKQSATGQQANITSFNSSEFDAMAPIAAADKPDAGIRSIDTDEVMAGAIPREGFTLRLINGGTGSGTACSRCHWLKHCQGCVLPDDANVQVQLRDGESIAVDWHYVVFEDLLDVQALSHIRRHDSMREERSSAFDLRTPLSDCLDKFTEQENLEDIVCPRCHDSDHMKRSFSLWRLPPVLIVQLKRFQFDRYSRRKLTNRIDFPFENLDLREYLAHSQLQQQSHAQSVAGGSAKAATDASAALKMNALYGSFESLTDTAAASDREGLCSGGEGAAPAGACTRYDLYSVIHHLGALGGGHYAATIRHPRHDAKGRLIPAHDQQQQGLFSSIISGVSNIMDVEGDSGHGADSVEPVAARSHQPEHEVPATRFQADDPWYIYNDNLVTEVTNTSELSAPSAYVLFYMRQDVEYKNINELLQEQLGDHFAALDGSSTACNAPAAANVIEAQPAASAASIPIVSDVVKADGISRGVGMSRDAATKPGKMPFTAASISLRGSDPSVSFSTSDGTSAEISTLAAAAAASRGPMLGGQGSRSKSSVSRTSPHAATVQHEASDSGSSERDRSRRGSGGGAVPGNDSESFQNDQPLYLTSSNAVKNRQYAPPVNGVAASAAMESEADPNCVMQ